MSPVLTAVLGRDQFERALAAASAVGGPGAPITGLAVPLEVTWRDRVAEAWDAIAAALREAFERGRDVAAELVDAAVRAAEDCVREAGERARDVQQALLDRLRTYLAGLIDEALTQVRPAVVLGDVTLPLQSVQISQEIATSGSLKASITELVQVTAEGRLGISAVYGVAEGGAAAQAHDEGLTRR